jgi:polyhydroxybutyrate depolymerase
VPHRIETLETNMSRQPHGLLATLLLSLPLCGQSLLERGIEVDGVRRDYLLFAPDKADEGGQRPLVLMLHGLGSSGRQAASNAYGWVDLARKEGFAVAFPNAIGIPRGWNAAWQGENTADGDFLAQLIDALVLEFHIDPKQVFITGHSSGGIMSFSFAATHSDKVAAIGPVSGTIGAAVAERTVTIPKPKGPVSVISFHGMADNIVPYDEVLGAKARYSMLLPAPRSAAFFADANRCEGPDRKTLEIEVPAGRNGRAGSATRKVFLDSWGEGEAGTEVRFYSIEGGDHGWPRRGLDATALIWEFFTAHPRKDDRWVR